MLVLSHFGCVNSKLDEAVGITPFVVVPGNNLDEIAVDDVGELKIDNAGVGIAAIIDRNELIFGGGEDALVIRIGGSALEDVIDFFFAGWTLGDCSNVGKGNYWGWNANRKTIEFALEARNGKSGGFAGAGRGWHDVFGGRAGFADIFGWSILKFLASRVAVNGSHHSFFDAEIVFEDFHDWSDTVGSAGSVGDNLIVGV